MAFGSKLSTKAGLKKLTTLKGKRFYYNDLKAYLSEKCAMLIITEVVDLIQCS